MDDLIASIGVGTDPNKALLDAAIRHIDRAFGQGALIGVGAFRDGTAMVAVMVIAPIAMVPAALIGRIAAIDLGGIDLIVSVIVIAVIVGLTVVGLALTAGR